MAADGVSLRLCLETADFLRFLRFITLGDPEVIEECARQCHLIYPPLLGSFGVALGDSGGGPAHIEPLKNYICGQVKWWEVNAVEITMAPDFATVAKPHEFKPPNNFSSDPDAEKQWWRETLGHLVDIIEMAQKVQCTNTSTTTPDMYDEWGQSPLLIWAKPVSVQQSPPAACAESQGSSMYRI